MIIFTNFLMLPREQQWIGKKIWIGARFDCFHKQLHYRSAGFSDRRRSLLQNDAIIMNVQVRPTDKKKHD